MTSSRVQTSSLRCKNNCGFYGNPSWNGYCSVCYREHCVEPSYSRTNIPTTITTVSTLARATFDAKRKELADKGSNAWKILLRSAKVSSEDGRDSNSELSEERRMAVNGFNSFLHTLKASVSADVSRLISKILEELETMGGSHINQYSVAVQQFYQKVSNRIASSSLYSNLSGKTGEDILCAVERFLTTWIYGWAFSSAITDDESLDLKLQEKLRSLHWVTPSLLGSPVNPRSANELVHLDAATLALIKVNELFASIDKLDQIAECCSKVFEALKEHYDDRHVLKPNNDKLRSSPATTGRRLSPSTDIIDPAKTPNADDFLPTLIWLVIRTNPPLLHSNLQFIMRFANQNRLNSGKSGYFFTNLSCALHFLTNLTHESLNLSEQEFYRCMRTGRQLVRHQADQSQCDQLVADNEIRLLDLEDGISEINSKLTTFEQELNSFDKQCRDQLQKLQKDTVMPAWSRPNLDPEFYESPHVLLLNPTPNHNKPDPADQSTSDHVSPSLLDCDLDDGTAAANLPTPIQPSPYAGD